MGDRISHPITLLGRLSAINSHLNKLRCALAITHDPLSKLKTEISECSLKVGQDVGIVCRNLHRRNTRSRYHCRIVGRCVTIDRNTIEARVDRTLR